MITILATLLPMLAPAVTDGIRGIFAKITGGAGGAPQNVAERVQLMNAENARLQALAQIDTPTGNISQWVADFRAFFRYGIISIIWLATLCVIAFAPDTNPNYVNTLLDLSGACMSFIIGERFYFKLK